MDQPKPRGPWWRKKRWWAAAVLWIIAAYPLSFGPVFYARGAGWISQEATAAYYRPYALTTDLVTRYSDAAFELGRRHRRGPP